VRNLVTNKSTNFAAKKSNLVANCSDLVAKSQQNALKKTPKKPVFELFLLENKKILIKQRISRDFGGV